jgi:hypothetical protein
MIDKFIQPVTDLLSKWIPDADAKAQIAFQLSTMADSHAQERALAQIALAQQDAKGNWFQAGWRPLCGYTCVFSLMVNFIIIPIASGFNVDIAQTDWATMSPILIGMLGLGTMRSTERVKGFKR